MFKKLMAILVAEILMIPAVGLIFANVSDRFRAGMIAGSLFIALGVWIVSSGLRDRDFRKLWTFFIGCVHLFAIALPMVITRILTSDLSFEAVRIWGLPGPIFHRLSTGLYVALVVATVFELIRARREGKASGQQGLGQ